MKNKLKIILLTIAIVLAVLCILVLIIPLLFGYKPIYMQEYNINLEKTYYVWATLGSVATVVAIFIAILIPNKIAKKQNTLIEKQAKIAEQQTEILDQQNKIALFEKRYEIYHELLELRTLKEILEQKVLQPFFTNDAAGCKKFYSVQISAYLKNVNIQNQNFSNLTEEQKEFCLIGAKLRIRGHKLSQIKFLFSEKTLFNAFETLNKHLLCFIPLCNSNSPIDDIEVAKKAFLDSYDKFGDDIIAQVEKTLKL